MTTTKTHKVIAVLKVYIAVELLIALVKAILAAMTGNKYFPSPNPPLATISTQLTAVENAQTVALTKVKGAAADRNAKLAVLRNQLHDLRAYVQSVANADPENAEAIILSAGMTTKRARTTSKQDLTAKAGKVSGLVDLVARATAKRASYDWQVSTDQKTWAALPSTLQARTSVPNLTPGTTVYFRHRAVTKAGTGDWSQVVAHVVT